MLGLTGLTFAHQKKLKPATQVKRITGSARSSYLLTSGAKAHEIEIEIKETGTV